MTRRASTTRKKLVLFLFLSGSMVLVSLLAVLLPSSIIDLAFKEGGLVEAASAAALGLGALILLGDLLRDGRSDQWHLALLTAALALRELDMDKALTEHGILSARLYSGSAPVEQKILGALILTTLVWTALRLLRRDLRPWVAALKRDESRAWLLGAAFGLYGAAKALDGAGRKLAPWGIELSDATSRFAARAEEGMEMLAALLVFLACLSWRRLRA
ncbi:hypothetical protein [Paracoccus tibetensis]|uniref:Uncharacterized protein n=1 Tax=Paracoccus tibetensis TaxID=336292 RepID=A0A1G5KAD7_9RHOB|nr:hypothetical protein [Paracoccus tibetensis]SCY96980.1 hypothetical protein SAMN05660710_03787 [Paracoccus tibetensis]